MKKIVGVVWMLGWMVQASQSYALGIAVLGGGNYFLPRTNFTNTIQNGLLYNFGLAIDGKLKGKLYWELGAFYSRLSWGIQNISTYEASVVQFPVLLRFRFGKLLALQAGGYASYGLGNIVQTAGTDRVTYPFNEFGQVDISGTPVTLGLKRWDYGLLGGTRSEIWISKLFAILIDTRVYFGLNNLILNLPAATNFNTLLFQGMIGLRLGSQPSGSGGRR